MRRNPRIFGAFLVGGALVAAAFVFAPKATAPENADGVIVAGAPQKNYIAVTDSDNDGIPDWEETFNPNGPVTVTLPEESGEPFVPDSLTGEVMVDIVKRIVEREWKGPYAKSNEEIVDDALDRVVESVADELYTTDDLTLTANDSLSALAWYSNRVAHIIVSERRPEGSRDEFAIMADAAEQDDPAILEELDPIIEGYTRIRDSLLLLEVPTSMATEHILLLNSVNGLLNDITAMRNAFDDPLLAMARMKRYIDDAQGLQNAITRIFGTIYEQGVVWEEGDTALELISVQQ